MKSFKFKFNTVTWVLLAVVLALSIAGLAWNIFSATQFAPINKGKMISSIIMCVLCGFLGFLSASVMTGGKYVVTDKAIISYMGIIKSTFDINDVTEITHFKKSDKLVVYFKPDRYVVIVIAPTQYDLFIKTVRQVNPAITFDSQIDGEDTPN